MHHVRQILLLVGVIIALVAAVLLGKSYFEPDTTSSFTVGSTVFKNGGQIPARYTCVADNLSPPMTFNNAPKDTKSIVLIMHDLDGLGGDFTHWLVWDIPPATKSFSEGALVAGAVQGTADFGIPRYGGPCPSQGIHRYVFDAYALDKKLELPTSARRAELEAALKEHTLARSSLSASVTAP